MATFIRANTRAQRAHSCARSAGHQRDKAQAEARALTDWIAIPDSRPPKRERSIELASHEFTFDGARFHRCQGAEEYPRYLEAEATKRNWFWQETTRHGRPSRFRRRARTALEIHVITFAPWLAAHVQDEIENGRDPLPTLARIRERFMAKVAARLAGKRHIVGLAFHGDVPDHPHWDLCLSRQAGDGTRIGAAGLGLAGPWVVGVDRQLRSGASIAPAKEARFRGNLRKCAERTGTEQPHDVALARDLDDTASEVIGTALVPFMARYAAEVPKLEEANLKAAIARHEAARANLVAQLPSPSLSISI